MKFSFTVLALVGFTVTQILAAPSSEPRSEIEDALVDSNASTVAEASEGLEESNRAKKSPAPKTICVENKDLQGTSYLQCREATDSDSAGSFNVPSYSPAPSSYGPSPSSYNAPSAPSYNAAPSYKPAASYNAPSAPSYNAPSAPSYSAPAPAYKPAQSSYSSPPSYSHQSYGAPSYSPPAPSYKPAAAPSYGPPSYAAPSAPSYNQPQPSYKPAPASYAPAPSYKPQAPPSYGVPSYAPQPSYKPAPAPSYNSYGGYREAEIDIGSPYGPPAPSYSPPSYSPKPSYSPVYAGPAQSYTYPSPAPPVPCPTNLLFSCAPQVAPVPCSSVSYASAPAYKAPSYGHSPAPSYSPPAPSYSPPAPSYSPAPAPPSYRQSEVDNEITSPNTNNGLPTQPENTLDDLKKDW